MSIVRAQVDVLRSAYLKRKAHNSRYSMRSYARDLGINQSLLSKIMSGKRPLTAAQAVRALSALSLSSLQKDILLGVKKTPKTSLQEPTVELSLDFDLSWVEVAILDLVTLKTFKNEVSWIASKLGIDEELVNRSLERLEARRLISFEGHRISKTRRRIQFSPQVSLEYVRQYHQTMIQKAWRQLEKSDEISFQSRAIRGVTLAVDSAKLEEAKKRIEKFTNEISGFLAAGESDSLYQLNIQLFPLIENNGHNKKSG